MPSDQDCITEPCKRPAPIICRSNSSQTAHHQRVECDLTLPWLRSRGIIAAYRWMTAMSDLDSTRQREGGAASQVLIWGGVFLLLAGGLLIYPYISSRLVTIPPTSTPVPSPTSLLTFPPILAVTDTPPPSPPPPTSLPASTGTPPHEPTSPPPPTATTAPALPSRIVIPSLSVDAPVLPVPNRNAEFP